MTTAPIKVQMDVYSGLPNPTWELTPEQAKDTLELLQRGPQYSSETADADTLGYRGLFLEDTSGANRLCGQNSIFVPASHLVTPAATLYAHHPHVASLEQYLLSTNSEGHKHASFRSTYLPPREAVIVPALEKLEHKAKEPSIESLRGINKDEPPAHGDFAEWNALAHVRRNNCYNYASNVRTDTFAQPGRRATGQGIPQDDITGPTVRAASIADGVLEITDGIPQGYHKVALVVAERLDYHWARLNANSTWTHKRGQTPANNHMNGKVVTDPETHDWSPYTFVCYMKTNHHVEII